MIKDYAVAFYIVIGVAVAITVAFSFPPLTTPDSGQSREVQKQAKVKTALGFCRNNLSDVNCKCFAQAAGHVLSHERREVRGFLYADRTDLARGQASSAC